MNGDNEKVETTSIKSLMDNMPEGLRNALPDELKARVDNVQEGDKDTELVVDIIMFLSSHNHGISQQDLDRAEKVLDNVCTLINRMSNDLPNIMSMSSLSDEQKQQFKGMNTKMYQACQRFCVTYNTNY